MELKKEVATAVPAAPSAPTVVDLPELPVGFIWRVVHDTKRDEWGLEVGNMYTLLIVDVVGECSVARQQLVDPVKVAELGRLSQLTEAAKKTYEKARQAATDGLWISKRKEKIMDDAYDIYCGLDKDRNELEGDCLYEFITAEIVSAAAPAALVKFQDNLQDIQRRMDARAAILARQKVSDTLVGDYPPLKLSELA